MSSHLIRACCVAVLACSTADDTSLGLVRSAQAQTQSDAAAEIIAASQNVVRMANQGQWREALALAKETLDRAQALLGERHRETLTALNNYAVVLRSAGRTAEAVPYYERAVQLSTEVRGEKDRTTLTAFKNHAGALREVGRVADALRLHERALLLSTQALGEKDPDTLHALYGYAGALLAAGRVQESLPHYERALKWRIEVLGEDHPDAFGSLIGYSVALDKAGRSAESLRYHERAVKLHSAKLGEKHPITLLTLDNHGAALTLLGRFAEALVVYRRALTLRIEVLGERHPETLLSMTNYANVLGHVGRSAEALQYYERAFKLGVETLGENHPGTLHALHNYAHALFMLDRAAEALPLYERSLRALTQMLGERHPNTLTTLSNYSAVLQRLKGPEQALPHYVRALKLRTETLGETHPDTLDALNNYALTLQRLDRVTEALPYYERYVAGVEALRESAARDSAESQRGVFGVYVTGYHNYLVALGRAGRLREVLTVLERTKARTLLEQMALRSAAAGSGLPEADSQKLAVYAHRIGALDTRIAHAAGDQERETLKTERNTASRELAELKRALQTQFPRFRQITEVRLASARDARALLPANGVFVSYVVTGNGLMYALTLTAEGTIRWVDIGVVPGLADTIEALRIWTANPGRVMRDDLGRRIQILHWTQQNLPRWRVVTAGQTCSEQEMRQDARRNDANAERGLDRPTTAQGNAGTDCVPPGAEVVNTAAQYQQLADFVGKLLIEPIKKELAGKTQIIISPDGPLALTPWDVLPFDGKPLIAQFEVSQVQSLSVLKLIKERQTQYGKAGAREALLAMGNPDYGRSGGAGVTRGEAELITPTALRAGANLADTLRKIRWAPLPGTQVEMDQAAKIFAGQSRVISGAAASESTLRALSTKGELAQFRYLLFAAHGYFDPNFPSYSSLVLTPEGLEPERDGYVTLGEWTGLNLRSDLTLLSACNSARGENISGEGLMGLSYALYVAGNTNTVLTLWPVADEETAEFVASFLAKVKAGQGHAQALTATKREFLSSANPRKRNPFFWAPFVLYGA